jgi:hypothetical protein
VSVGADFAKAIAVKDFEQVGSLLDPELDFRAMTPRRSWEAASPSELVDVLRAWFAETDHIDELVEFEEGSFADRGRMSYSFRGHNDDGPYVVEQQAYFTEKDGRIDWLRVMCSGFRPAG